MAGMRVRVVAVVVALCSCATAGAGFVVNGTIGRLNNGTPNDYTDDSATIDLIRFTAHSAGDVVIDMLSWELDERSGSPTFGQALDLNMNGRIAFFDTQILLFSATPGGGIGDFIGKSDDEATMDGFGDGSIDAHDSFLPTILKPGDYVLAISTYQLSIEDVLAGVNALEGADGPVTAGGDRLLPSDVGDYRATFTGDVSLTTVIPLPASAPLAALGMACLCGARAARWRRRRR